MNIQTLPPVISKKRDSTTGSKYCQRKKMKTINKMRLFRCAQYSILENRGGSAANKTFEPSKGGTGIRLKTKSTMLIKII